jgi:mRNA interferase RelE/StbE
MTFRIELAREAESDLEALYHADRRLFRRILSKVGTLAETPREEKPLVGNHRGEFSLRVGNYRIVYELDAANHAVYILTVKHRRRVY